MKLPHILLSLLCCMACCSCARSAQVAFPEQDGSPVVTFPGPDGIRASDQFSVTVNGKSSFTYKTNAQYSGNTLPIEAASWTSFDFSGGPVTVQITKLKGTAGAVKIRPTSYGITPVVNGNVVTFTLDKPRKVSVECSGDPLQAMFIFAGTPETDIPNPDDPNVVYWGPGVHDVGNNYQLVAGKTYYLAGGAWVKGMFRGGGDNVRICGRGVLSSAAYPHNDGPGSILISGTDITIEGITVTESPGWTVSGGTTHRDLRLMGWYHNTDGITTRAGAEASVEDCFIMNYDDQFIVGGRALTMTNLVLYPLRGSCFQISWNVSSAAPGATLIKDVDIIHYPSNEDYDGVVAVFSMNHGGRADLGNITFEDIRVESMEGSVKRFCSLRLAPNPWSRVPVSEIGSLSNVTFRNITINGSTYGNRIHGLSPTQTISNIHFENLVINGQPITNAAQADIDTNQFTSNITFSTPNTVETPVLTPPTGKYNTAQTVTMSTATNGASIRYTLDGSTPTPTTGAEYKGAFAIDHGGTVKAIAYKTGMNNSGIATSLYTIGDVAEPSWEGMIYDNNISSRDGTLETNLKKAGFTTLLYQNSATSPDQPSWWKDAPAYFQVRGTKVVYDWMGIKWNGMNLTPLFGEGDGRGGVAKITIFPNVTTPTTRKMAVILSTGNETGLTRVQLTSIKTGATTTTFNQALTASSGNASVGEVTLQVRPLEPIEIVFHYDNIQWSGISLAFSDK